MSSSHHNLFSRKILLLTTLLLIVFLSFTMALTACENDDSSESGKIDGNDVDVSNDGKQEGTTGKSVQVILFFPADFGGELSLVQVSADLPSTEAIAEASVEALLKGPSDTEGLLPVFPPGTKLRSIHIEEDGTCIVDFSKEIITNKGELNAGAEYESLVQKAIAETLCQFPSVNRVKLLIEGRQEGSIEGFYIEDFWGHTGLPEFIYPE